LKNGFVIDISLDTKMFDETVTFTGIGAEHSNFLAQNALLQEELFDLDELIALDSINREAKFQSIEKELADFYNASDNIDTSVVNRSINRIDPTITSYKRYIASVEELKRQLPKGTLSPVFEEYENFDGSTTSLSDLKGKYVYIDVWATWCGPCKAEIPSLKKVESMYHDKNISFVSLSVDDDRRHGGSWEKAHASWKQMVEEKELGGIQLYSPKGWKADFIQDFKINSIPRFILIDPEGKIVDASAPRPSSDELIKLFEEENI
jgi:thiol-disulfide isomerase/thioredoxin